MLIVGWLAFSLPLVSLDDELWIYGTLNLLQSLETLVMNLKPAWSQ